MHIMHFAHLATLEKTLQCCKLNVSPSHLEMGFTFTHGQHMECFSTLGKLAPLLITKSPSVYPQLEELNLFAAGPAQNKRVGERRDERTKMSNTGRIGISLDRHGNGSTPLLERSTTGSTVRGREVVHHKAHRYRTYETTNE